MDFYTADLRERKLATFGRVLPRYEMTATVIVNSAASNISSTLIILACCDMLHLFKVLGVTLLRLFYFAMLWNELETFLNNTGIVRW